MKHVNDGHMHLNDNKDNRNMGVEKRDTNPAFRLQFFWTICQIIQFSQITISTKNATTTIMMMMMMMIAYLSKILK